VILALQAVQFHKFMESGRTSPALCGCEGPNGENAGEFVVKQRGGMERGYTALVCELVASRMARFFGIPVPDPAIVSIDMCRFSVKWRGWVPR